jgi:hypothetical protein
MDMPRISLSNVVGRNVSAGNRLPDTLKLKLGLERLGYYESDNRGFTPGADEGLWPGSKPTSVIAAWRPMGSHCRAARR